MNVLFIHQNFPGQYLHLARMMQKMGGHTIVGLGENANMGRRGLMEGITSVGYPTPSGAGPQTHHYVHSFEAAVRRGQAVARGLLELKAKGFRPDVISAHPGWGEALFVRDVFPDVPILMFCEYYFRAGQADLGFDPEFPQTPDWSFSIRIRNSAQVMSLISASAGLSPTRWQASRYPDFVRDGLHVIHDGVNTDYMTPDRNEVLRIQPLEEAGESRLVDYLPPPVEPRPGENEGAREEDPEIPRGAPFALSAKDKVISYGARNLEPYRGFHVFLRALPEVQRRHPDAHILIIGHSGASYSPALPEGESYKAKYLAEVADSLDFSRIHFLGRIAYPALRAVFRITTAHVYFTYPFVLSWSALEAMSCGALLVGSDTPPVREVITHNEQGLLVDFFDREALVDTLHAALSDPTQFARLRENARAFVERRFALRKCLDSQFHLLQALASGRFPNPQ